MRTGGLIANSFSIMGLVMIYAAGPPVGLSRGWPALRDRPRDQEGRRRRQAQLEAHHKIDPGGRSLAERFDNRRALCRRQAVRLEDLPDLGLLGVRLLDHFLLLPNALAGVMLGVAARRQVAAQAHRNRPG